MTDSDAMRTEGADFESEQKTGMDALNIPEGQKITVHMAHLTHLDLTWHWQLPDTIEMCLETVRWNVEMLEQHPDARYSHAQAWILSVVEQIDPALFERFRKLVAGGQVELDSGQWVEPDHNLPTGESLARQFLYGQRYFQSRFGMRSTTLIDSDSFGHTRALPQLARQAGLKYMLFKRPRQHHVDLPDSPFLWKGVDGTVLPALRFINKGRGLPCILEFRPLPEGVSPVQAKVDVNLAAGVRHLFGSHCNADSGGATPYARPVSSDKYELIYDAPTSFWEAVMADNPEMPVVDSTLNYEFQGYFTTHIEEKEHCRRGERELREVELLWTLAALKGHGYPLARITELWKRLCFMQFHDILPGTGSPEAHADSFGHYYEIFLGANVLRRKAQILLDHMCKADDGAARTFLVANPRAQVCGGIVAADVEMPVSRWVPGECISTDGTMMDEDGAEAPYQIVDRRDIQRYVRGTVLFPASGVPPLGVKKYSMFPDKPAQPLVRVSEGALENEHLRVEIDGQGIIRSIVAKIDGRQCLKPVDAPVRLELWPETDFPGDYGTPMQAWMLGITDERENAAPVGDPVIVEEGPVRATIRVEHHWRDSHFTTDVSLYAGQEWVEVRIECDWHEKEVLCRLCVEPEIDGQPRGMHGIQFASAAATDDKLDVPAIGWADVSGDAEGFAVLNRDRAGHTFRDDAIRTSIVRCATGNHDPCTDSGVIRTVLRLFPHKGNANGAGVAAKADEFNYPPAAWQSEAFGDDTGGWSTPLNVDGEGVLLSGCKVTEDRSGIMLRLYESRGATASAILTLGEPLQNCRVVEADIIEDEGRALSATGNQIELSFRPFEVKTLIVKLDKPVPDTEPGFGGLWS